jgi:O-antigen ligase
MLRERLDHWCEKGILGLVLAIVVFGPLAIGGVDTFQVLVLLSLTIAVGLLWVFRFWLNPSPKLLWPPICWCVLAFAGYAVVRYLQADLEYVARWELVKILMYGFLFLAILNNLHRQSSTQLFALVLVFLGMAISLYAVYQFLTDSQKVWHFLKPAVYAKRASGTYICPNHLAGFLEMVLPVGLALTLTGRLKPVPRILVGYASLAILAGIGVTISRGGWIAAGLSLLVLFVLLVRERQHRLPALVLLVVLVGAGTFFVLEAQQVQKRVHRVFAVNTPQHALVRFWIWQPALQMWRDHRWWGVGPAHFDYRFPAYRPAGVQARPGRVHNDYLNTLVDWGMVGAAVVAAAWVALYVGVFKAWKFVRREPNDLGSKQSNRSAIVLGGAIGLLALLIHSGFDFNLHIPANAITAITLMALLSGYFRFATERYWFRLALLTRILGSIVLSAGLLYLGRQMWRGAQEYAWLERAAKEQTLSVKRLAALKQAATLEPTNFETTYEIGEGLRQLSWQGLRGNQGLAAEALQWFERGMRLNPYGAYNYLRAGMCLDWLDRHTEATSYFDQALGRDPNNYYLVALQGWHFMQMEDYVAAKTAFERSKKLKWWDNPIAFIYLPKVEQKLKETAPPK